MLKSMRCNGCGAMIHIAPGVRQVECEYCGNIYTIREESNQNVNSEDRIELVKKVNLLLAEADRYRESNDVNSEIAVLLKAVELMPNHMTAWTRLGRAYRLNGMLDKALSCYNNAIKINPNDGTVYGNIGVVYIYKGDPNTAIKYFEKSLPLIKKDPNADYPTMLANYAVALGKSGNKQEAAKVLKEAEKLGYKNAKIIRKQFGIGGFWY